MARLLVSMAGTAKPYSGLAVPHREWTGTTKPKIGLAVPPGWTIMRKFLQQLYAIGTLHNLSVGEELGLGLNFY